MAQISLSDVSRRHVWYLIWLEQWLKVFPSSHLELGNILDSKSSIAESAAVVINCGGVKVMFNKPNTKTAQQTQRD